MKESEYINTHTHTHTHTSLFSNASSPAGYTPNDSLDKTFRHQIQLLSLALCHILTHCGRSQAQLEQILDEGVVLRNLTTRLHCPAGHTLDIPCPTGRNKRHN